MWVPADTYIRKGWKFPTVNDPPGSQEHPSSQTMFLKDHFLLKRTKLLEEMAGHSRKYARQVRNSLPDHKPSKLAQSTEAHEKDLRAPYGQPHGPQWDNTSISKGNTFRELKLSNIFKAIMK